MLTISAISPYIIALILIIIVWLFICMIISFIVLKMITKPHIHTIEEMRKQQIEAEHINFDRYDIEWNKQPFELNGLHGKLRGHLIINKESEKDQNARRYVSIICHGHTVNHVSSIKYGMIFYDLGFDVIIYDHGYHGESEGEFTTLGNYERYDLSKVIDYARLKFGKDCILALHGESMGAVTVLTELGLRSDINLVVADCPFGNTFNYLSELFRQKTKLPSFPIIQMIRLLAKILYGFDFYDCNPIDCVKNSDVPICFIHGKNDSFINCYHSVEMFNVAQNHLSELHLIDNADHACSFLVENNNYKKIVRKFVSKVLKKER